MRTAVVTVDGDRAHVLAGLTGLVVLKTTGSEFWGFPRDEYTTLAETRERILATAVTARWRYTSADLDWNAAFTGVRTALLEAFAGTHSLALQQSLYAMGEAALERNPDVAEVRLSLPNKHHFLQDLSAFGLRQPGRRLPRRRPAIRPDRGHRRAGRRRAGTGRLGGHARVLLSQLAADSMPTPASRG